ncbi:hypothetical protein LCGC14_2841780, partial [marine sediment metagenome]
MDLSHCGSDPGRVLDPLGSGLAHPYLARLLAVSTKTVTRGLDKMVKLGMIKIDSDGVITIVDYWTYQPIPTDRSEYWKDRYAKQRAKDTSTHNQHTSAHTPKKEIEKEREKETHTPSPSPAKKDMRNFRRANLPPTFQDEFVKLFNSVFSRETAVPFI